MSDERDSKTIELYRTLFYRAVKLLPRDERIELTLDLAEGISEILFAEHKCKFCGLPSEVDPSDQCMPLGECHESDHTYR